jgi:hypothetical protein
MERRDFLKKAGFGLALALTFPTFSKSPFLEEKVLDSYNEVFYKFNLIDKEKVLVVNGQSQEMYLTDGEDIFRNYDVSTSKYGFGEISNTNKTPRGIHRIKEKIGENSQLGTIFKGKKNTGKIAKIYESPYDSSYDYITTRVLSLEGMEEKNKNSFERFIYIHGTPEEGLIGTSASQGCIRMKNKDIIDLYDLVNVGTYVNIKEFL